MTDKQKEFIVKAKEVDYKEKFSYNYKSLYVFNSGKRYDDEKWAEYNNIIIIGYTDTNEYINITDFSDIYEIANLNELATVRTDIPRELGCIRHWIFSGFHFKLIYCMSDCRFEVVRNGK